jgi:Ni/Co efflux regulator RcnB
LPPPGYGLRRGGIVPPEARGAIVPDYGRLRLRPPPPGFAWVRMGDRYMLVSRATGQIFDVIGR